MPPPAGHGTSLAKFFIFNPTISKKETTEHENILYYYPSSTHLDRQTIDVGLARGLINFTRTFSPDQPIELAQTEKHQQVFHEHEPNFWFVMVCARPKKEVGRKEKDADIRELEHHILLAILHKACRMLKLMHGSISKLLEQNDQALKQSLQSFFDIYLPLMNFDTADMFDTVDGIQFLPTDRTSFLRTQSFINKVETQWEEDVLASTVLVDDFLLYSGVCQNDTRSIYSFLTKRKQRARGEKINPNRGDNLLFLSYPYTENATAFLTMEEHGGKRIPVPIKVFAGETPENSQPLHMVVWQNSRALFVFYVTERCAKSITFYEQLEAFMMEEIKNTVAAVLERVGRTDTGTEEVYQYIYFNHMNLALKSTLKKKGALIQSNATSRSSTDIPELMGYIESMHADFLRFGDLKEVIMKIKQNEQWVVGRRASNREFYALFDTKKTLAEVNETLKLINQQFFNSVFVD
jgi:hypothetical protein